VTLNASASAAWSYLRFEDPGAGQYRLAHVRRADNSEIALGTNAWTTDRIFRGGDLRPIRTNLVHVLDYNSSGNYTLLYEVIPSAPDTNAPSSAVAALPATTTPGFAVNWSGVDDTNGSGIAFFNIYVSDNGGSFTPWLSNVTYTGGLYNGAPGHTYAFYSRAVDFAGNIEPAPASPDAQVSLISATNTPPVFTPVLDQTVPEGATFTFTPVVTDADVPAQSVSFSLLPGSPASAFFSAANGRITWQTGESDGGSVATFSVVATDNGSPSLSATQTFTVTVSEVNSAPAITTSPAQVSVNEGSTLSVPFSATDPDLPAQTLTWTLAAGAPSGISIDPATGLLTWIPTEEQGPSTNQVSVILRDNGSPNRTDTRNISIVVNEVNRAAQSRVEHGSVPPLAGPRQGKARNEPRQQRDGKAVDIGRSKPVLFCER